MPIDCNWHVCAQIRVLYHHRMLCSLDLPIKLPTRTVINTTNLDTVRVLYVKLRQRNQTPRANVDPFKLLNHWATDPTARHCLLGRRVDQLLQALNLTQQLCDRCPAPESFPTSLLVQMAILSCPISTIGSAVNAMSS